jgi:RND family efflux transporter MFP subunit
VTLTEEAAARLGIETLPVERRAVPRRRTYGGQVIIPTGNLIQVTAPTAGTLDNPDDAETPAPGSHVEAGQPVFSFVPFLPPERDVPTPAERVQMADAQASLVSSQIVAQGDVERAEAEVEAAEIALQRAQQLQEDMVGSARAVDDAQAALNIATANLEAAKSRHETLQALTLDSSAGQMRRIEIIAPEAGILHDVAATRGQTVTAGAPLFQIADLSTLWVRVPVYVGQLDEIVADATASVGSLDRSRRNDSRSANPVVAPPSADVLSSTVHLFYELPNDAGTLRPGERVAVSVPLQGEGESLVVPSSAVLYDIHGTSWVYEQIEPLVYARHRVLVAYVTPPDAAQSEMAVLSEGPEPGTEVVVEGTAELFGTEFGAGH